MATKFEEIYDLFLPTIDDYEWSAMEDADISQLMKSYLMNGLIHVMNAMSDIENYDSEKEEFADDLFHVEKVALAKAMKLEWVGEKLYSAELMRKSIGDRDYNAVQGTDYVRRLSELSNSLKKEIQQDLNNFSYTKAEFVGDLWG